MTNISYFYETPYENMNFEITQEGQYAILKSAVEKLDANNAPGLKSELQALNRNGVNNFIIDLSATRYCDSSGLSAILTANRLSKDTNGKLVLCGLQEPVMKMIRISQLDKVFNIRESVEEASALMSA